MLDDALPVGNKGLPATKYLPQKGQAFMKVKIALVLKLF